jgi:hypothetical protein
MKCYNDERLPTAYRMLKTGNHEKLCANDIHPVPK